VNSAFMSEYFGVGSAFNCVCFGINGELVLKNLWIWDCLRNYFIESSTESKSSCVDGGK